MDVYETGIEYIVAKGPIDQAINILVHSASSTYNTGCLGLLTGGWCGSANWIEYNSEVDMVRLLRITQVWNQNGRAPYITFEYTVLRDSLPPVPPPPVYTGADTSAGEVSVEVVGLLAPNSSLYVQAAPEGHLDSGGGEVQKGQETNEVYEESAAKDCDQDTAAAPKYSGRAQNNVGSH